MLLHFVLIHLLIYRECLMIDSVWIELVDCRDSFRWQTLIEMRDHRELVRNDRMCRKEDCKLASKHRKESFHVVGSVRLLMALVLYQVYSD